MATASSAPDMVALLDRSFHTRVGSCTSVSAFQSSTSVATPGVPPLAAGTEATAQVTCVGATGCVPGPLASVNVVPSGAGMLTEIGPEGVLS